MSARLNLFTIWENATHSDISALPNQAVTGNRPEKVWNSFNGVALAPLCPALSIGDADGNKCADCLSPLKGGRVSGCSGRIVDAQGSAKLRGTRAFSFASFSVT